MAKYSLTLFALLSLSPAGLFASDAGTDACLKNNKFDKDVNNTHLHCEYSPADGLRKWTITRPEVTKPLTEYPDIVFEPYDRVLVSAQGCVNVGKTVTSPDWRRYVDPEGSWTDRFLHGLIWIPGARIYDKSEYLVTPVGTAPVRILSIAGGA